MAKQYRVPGLGTFNDATELSSQRWGEVGTFARAGSVAVSPLKPNFNINRYRIPHTGTLNAIGIDASYRVPESGTHFTFSEATLARSSVSTHSNIYRRRRRLRR